MACGLEVRVPFCDHRIMEYAYNIPWEMKYYKDREKGLLREAFTGVLPEDVLWRKKSPYPKTHNPAFLTGVKEIIAGLLESKGEPLFEILSRDKVSELITSGTQDLNKTWYGQLMSLPQTIAYFIQMNYWLKAYHVDITL